MKQALHIFRKDVRYLRWELGVALLFMAMFIYGQLHPQGLGDSQNAIMSLLLLAFWAFLCARLVQAESIPGDRQFWITRPYRRSSLLGAKLLFVVVCIGIPLMAADAAILGEEGFSVVAHLPGLMLSLLLITASALMVFCAFATLTRGLTDWIFGAIIAAGVLYTLDTVAKQSVWGGMEWMREYGAATIVFLAALVVLLGQYRRRRTRTYLAVMVAGLLGSLIYAHYANSGTALELETRFSTPKADTSSVRIVFEKPPERAAPLPDQYHPARQEMVALAFPMEVEGLADGEDLMGDGERISIPSESGEILGRTARDGGVSHALQRTPTGYRLLMLLSRAALEKTEGRTVQMHITFYLTMLRPSGSQAIWPGAGAVDIPGIGRCREDVMEGGNWILCASPLRAPSNFLVLDRFPGPTSYSPFPADPESSIIPLGRYFHSAPPGSSPATLISLEPIAHFRRDVDLNDVSLADYQILSR